MDTAIANLYEAYLRRTGDAGAAATLVLATVQAGGGYDSGTLNPPDVAKLLRVSPSKVIGWIRNGQLNAANVATGKRPRYVIQRTDLDAFLKNRQPEPPAAKRRQRKLATVSKRFAA